MVDMALTWQKTHYVNNTENSKNFEDIYRKHLQVLRREPNVIQLINIIIRNINIKYSLF